MSILFLISRKRIQKCPMSFLPSLGLSNWIFRQVGLRCHEWMRKLIGQSRTLCWARQTNTFLWILNGNNPDSLQLSVFYFGRTSTILMVYLPFWLWSVTKCQIKQEDDIIVLNGHTDGIRTEGSGICMWSWSLVVSNVVCLFITFFPFLPLSNFPDQQY